MLGPTCIFLTVRWRMNTECPLAVGIHRYAVVDRRRASRAGGSGAGISSLIGRQAEQDAQGRGDGNGQENGVDQPSPRDAHDDGPVELSSCTRNQSRKRVTESNEMHTDVRERTGKNGRGKSSSSDEY